MQSVPGFHAAACFQYLQFLCSSQLTFLVSALFPGSTELNAWQVRLQFSLLQPGLAGGRAGTAEGGGTCRQWMARRRGSPAEQGCARAGLWAAPWCRRWCDGSPPVENNHGGFLIGRGGCSHELQICRKPGTALAAGSVLLSNGSAHSVW